MRALLSLLLALLVFGLVSVDPIVCPDGCSDEPIGHAQSAPAAAAPCALCVGVRLSPLVLTHAPLASIEPVHSPLVLPVLTPDLPGIDHPPRLA